jgi:hypothetical protein
MTMAQGCFEVKPNPSVRILKGLGFRCIGTIYDEGYEQNQLEWHLDRANWPDTAGPPSAS